MDQRGLHAAKGLEIVGKAGAGGCFVPGFESLNPTVEQPLNILLISGRSTAYFLYF
jgi:hypothetical protein